MKKSNYAHKQIQEVTFLLMLYAIFFSFLCLKTTRTIITTKRTRPMAMDDTRASDSPLEPVVDKTYGKELTCMEPHPVFNDHFVLWPLYQGFEI